MLALALLLAALLPAPTATAVDAASDARTGRGVLLGAHADMEGTTTGEEAIGRYEAALGRRLDVVRWYQLWDDPVPMPAVKSSVGHGRMVMLSILPKASDGRLVSWAEVASGAVDEQIRVHAAGVASLGVPVYLTFHHEANLPPGAEWGTPQEFRDAWRHYVQVFRDAGASNVLWTWIATPVGFSATAPAPRAPDFYPGDDVVDRVGADSYNWAGCAPGGPREWRSLEAITADFRRFAQAHGKTAVLPEWGSVEDTSDPTRKARWLTDAFGLFSRWPELEAAAYFDDTGTCSWRTTSSAASWEAYRTGANSSTAHARPSAALVASSLVGIAPLRVAFSTAGSTGAGAATGRGVTSWTFDPGDGTPAVVGTGQPGLVEHTYAGGAWTAVLTVVDASGARAVDRATIRAKTAPVITGAVERDVRSTSAALHVWVRSDGLAGTARFRWTDRETGATGTSTASVQASAAVQELSTPAMGLRPAAAVDWTVEVSTAAGTIVSTVRTLSTPGPPTLTLVPATGITAGSAVVKLKVNPHGRDTQAWVEYGTGSGMTGRSSLVSLAAATWERNTSVALTGLAPRTTFSYRVVAQNEFGVVCGPTGTFTTLSAR